MCGGVGCGGVGGVERGDEMITETNDLLAIKELQNEVKRLRKELATEQRARQSLVELAEHQRQKIERLERQVATKSQRGTE